MLLHLYFALDKQSLSAICLQREPGLARVEGCVSQDSCAVLQHLQIACALQCGKMLFIDGRLQRTEKPQTDAAWFQKYMEFSLEILAIPSFCLSLL